MAVKQPAEPLYDPSRPAEAAKKKARKGRSPLAHMNAVEVEAGRVDLTGDAEITTQADNEADLKADIERIRKLRKPFGSLSQKLALPERPGYHQHWFNDEPGRVDEAVANGWSHVQDREKKPIRRVVGRGRDSGALYAYAMQLPEIFWAEDVRARHQKAQDRVDEIRKNPFRSKPGQATTADQGKFYSPKDEVMSVREEAPKNAILGTR
jgi:hypothetical protein